MHSLTFSQNDTYDARRAIKQYSRNILDEKKKDLSSINKRISLNA